MINVYKHFLNNKEIPSGWYNAGFENISILEIAKKVSELIKTEIVVMESNDPRSYRQDSSKLLRTGFVPKFSVLDAIKEIANKYKDNNLPDGDNCYTVKWMKKLNLEWIKE